MGFLQNNSNSLIDGAFQIAGSLINGHQAKQADKRNMENWRMQTAYNSPAMQSARMRTAGIAPYQVAGQIASGSTADAPPRSEMPSTGQILSNAGNSISQNIIASKNTEIQAKAQESQAKVQAEQAELLKIEQRVQTANAIIDEWQSKFMEETHSSRVSASHWNTKAVEYGARDFMREYLDNKVMSLKERVANLGYVESQTQEKLYLAGAVAFDLFLKRKFGESMQLEQLYSLQLSNSQQRTINKYLPDQLLLRNGQMGQSFLFTQRELQKFDKMFGQEFYDTYLSGLLSEKERNDWFRYYYQFGNENYRAFGYSGPVGEWNYTPAGAYEMEVQTKRLGDSSTRLGMFTGVAGAIGQVAGAAAQWKPSVTFGPNGRYAINRGFTIDRNF